MDKIVFTVNGNEKAELSRCSSSGDTSSKQSGCESEDLEKVELSRCSSSGDTSSKQSGCESGDLEKVEFYVLEKTKIGGTDYILVTDMEEGDGDALILKDLSKPEEKDGLYEIVSEEKELHAVAAVFETLMDDVTFVSDEE